VTDIRSEVAGTVTEILVRPGEPVAPDQVLAVLESMKMEIPVAAPSRGTVREIRIVVGDVVDDGDVLLRLDPESVTL
jgi:acetyl-CoA carboxylase biotin carboxyl carrier protein